MNILFLTHDYPFPVTYGGQVYTGNVIREWAPLCDRMDVVCFKKGQAEPEAFTDGALHWQVLPAPPSTALRKLFSRWPGVAAVHVDPWFVTVVQHLLTARPYDFIVIDYIAIGWMIAPLRRILSELPGRRPKLVYMSHNVETLLRRQIAGNIKGGPLTRLAARFDAWRAERLERRLVHECDITTVETDEDDAAMRALLGARSVIRLAPGYDGEIVESRSLTADTPRNVAILGGRLSAMKQIVLDAFLDKAADGIVDAGIGLHVIGPTTDVYLAACRAAYPKTAFHGFVADVKPLLDQMRAGIVADHVGGGFKHRILTYVFYRVPIIALPEAMAGLPLVAGEDFIAIGDYAEIPAVLAAHIDRLDLLGRIQQSAFAKCSGAFSWPGNLAAFHQQLVRHR